MSGADAASVAALGGLVGMTPRLLAALLEGRSPAAALALVRRGGLERDAAIAPALGRLGAARSRSLAEQADRVDLAAFARAHEAAGVMIVVPGDPGWPERLADDPEPPASLCVRGDLAALDAPTCGIVGTRHCSPDGRRLAFALGRDLADAGVTVVSGLALGIDAGAHRGCLAAGGGGRPVGVVAGGLDLVYPPSHAELFAAVAGRGVLVSEVPLGVRPERWRFPARNRVIAGLSDIVVVVESAARGGSLHTVEAALARDRVVAAFPGPVSSPVSEGTNALLADGALLVRGADDVLLALGFDPRPAPSRRADRRRAQTAAIGALGPAAVSVHACVGLAATPLEDIVTRSGLDLGEALSALMCLAEAGHVEDVAGQWSRADASTGARGGGR